MRITALAVSVLLFCAIGCNFDSNKSASSAASSTPSGDQNAALMQTSRDWAKTAASGDVDRILSYWSDDAIVLEPEQPAHVGKAAIRAMVEGSMKAPKFSITWEPERASISQAGDVGYLIEHNRVTFADSTGKLRTVYGKAVTIWRKDASGNWKCAVDIWNGNPTEKVLPAS